MASHLDEYGDEPVVCVSVPARFHLLGEHTWFAQGNTLSIAIEYGIQLCISKRQDSNFRFFSIHPSILSLLNYLFYFYLLNFSCHYILNIA